MDGKLNRETAIAYRSFTLKDTGAAVDVFIGKPQKIHDEEWFCPYRIVGGGQDLNFQINGIDGIQVLQLVWLLIDANVAGEGWTLLWDGEEFEGFAQGLPRLPDDAV